VKLGIDYGTTTTLISYATSERHGSRSLLINIGGNQSGYLRSSIPSIIAVNKDKGFAIGYEAEKIAESGSRDVIVLRSLKRCLACEIKEGDESSVCWNPMNRPFCLGGQKLNLFNKTKTVRELVREFIKKVLELSEMREIIPRKGGLKKIGISVPAIFGSEPRHTIYDLLLQTYEDRIIIDVVNEPTAAIIACQKNMLKEKDGIYVICDVGGGTTDIVVFEKNGTSYFLFKPSGIKVAGDDIDNELMNHLCPERQRSPAERDKVLMEIRRAKELLTVSEEVTVFGGKLSLSRGEFEKIIEPVLGKIVEALRKEIKNVFNAYKPYRETGKEFKLMKIYLSGGGSKIPLLKDLICQDQAIRSLEPDVDFVRNDELYPIYKEDLPIVVVALGTSMPKSGISDAIQYMLPYAIHIIIGNNREEKVPIYRELPVEFDIYTPKRVKIEIIAFDPNNPATPIYNLTDGLVSAVETGETLLSRFLQKSNSFNIKIDKYNIMRVATVGLPRQMVRPFQLPWQGGIETALFDKYRREWRRKHGYS
jgi:actin-like ATPase involved in cell morphogenesis